MGELELREIKLNEKWEATQVFLGFEWLFPSLFSIIYHTQSFFTAPFT